MPTPKTPEEWSMVESYMALLEQLNVLINEGILSEATFHKLYGHRVHHIIYNDTIRREKLELEGTVWKEFLRLCMRRNIHVNLKHVWPPFFVDILILYETVVIGQSQIISIRVFDSLESLKPDANDVPVPNATVKIEILYPSNIRDTLEGNTNDSGEYRHYWVIKEESLPVTKKKEDDVYEAKVIVRVSEGDKESSELIRMFNIILDNKTNSDNTTTSNQTTISKTSPI